MRVVLDTNVIVSALLSPSGIPAQLLRYWELGYFEMLVCQRSLDELKRVLRYPKIRKRLAATNDELATLVSPFAEHGIWVSPQSITDLALLVKDATDMLYLEMALAGQASYVVSGDRHLLDIAIYEGIPILTPTRFAAELRAQGAILEAPQSDVDPGDPSW